MEITLNLTPYEIKEAIEEYVNKRGYSINHINNDISFSVKTGHDYYDNPTSPHLTQATITAKKIEDE